ncbi:MAG: DUF4157 domain-containing protein, partial [Myxococcota bacterium]
MKSGPTPSDPGEVTQAAAQGLTGAASPLPYRDRIQRHFGAEHDLSSVRAHMGAPAQRALSSLGAAAYAMGEQVALGPSPDLHTVAHESAHVIQQRAGARPPDGVGQVGDRYERHADAVADRVVAGRSAADLLSQVPGVDHGGGSPCRAVQRHQGHGHHHHGHAVDDHEPVEHTTGEETREATPVEQMSPELREQLLRGRYTNRFETAVEAMGRLVQVRPPSASWKERWKRATEALDPGGKLHPKAAAMTEALALIEEERTALQAIHAAHAKRDAPRSAEPMKALVQSFEPLQKAVKAAKTEPLRKALHRTSRKRDAPEKEAAQQVLLLLSEAKRFIKAMGKGVKKAQKPVRLVRPGGTLDQRDGTAVRSTKFGRQIEQAGRAWPGGVEAFQETIDQVYREATGMGALEWYEANIVAHNFFGQKTVHVNRAVEPSLHEARSIYYRSMLGMPDETLVAIAGETAAWNFRNARKIKKGGGFTFNPDKASHEAGRAIDINYGTRSSGWKNLRVPPDKRVWQVTREVLRHAGRDDLAA